MGSLTGLQQIGMGFAGLGAVNSAVGAYGQYQSGQSQKAAYDYNADVTLQQMQDQVKTSEAKYTNLIGKQATAYSAAGVDIASGSPLLVMSHTAAQGGAEQESEVQADTEEATLERYYGKVAAFSGTIGGISSFISGLSKSALSAGSIMGPSGYGTVPTVPASMFGQ
jgi:hypothetical protein